MIAGGMRMVKVCYQNARVFTGKNENFAEGIDFVVDEDTGQFVTTKKEIDRTIDLTGKYVMPGMINAHTHIVADPYGKIAALGSSDANAVNSTFLALENLQKFLEDGVTYIRDVGSVYEVDIELSKLEKQNQLLAPGIVASGNPLTMTGGHFNTGSYEVDGVDEVRKYARLLLKKGVDNIKLMATGGVSFNGESPEDEQLSMAELKAAVVEAHHQNKTACAHAQGLAGIKNAILAGVDSVEHAVYLDDKAIEMLVTTGTFVVPTLVAPWSINQHLDTLPDFMIRKNLEVTRAHTESIGKAARAGVKLAMGTDSGTAFNNFEQNSSKELELMTKAGVTNLQALQAATVNAARLLHIADKAGTIENGKVADFIVLEQNPLKDIQVLQKKKTVFKKGKKVQISDNHE